MANYAEPFAAVADFVHPKLLYNGYYSKENTLLLWYREHCKKSFTASGEYFKVPIQYGHTDDSVQFITGYEPLPITGTTDQDALKFKCDMWGMNISGSLADIKVRCGSDTNRIYDYWEAKTTTKTKAALRVLCTKAWGIDPGTSYTDQDLCGLGFHLLSATYTTYGGLTRGAASNVYNLNTQVDVTAGNTITLTKMQNMLMACRAKTEVMITTKTIFGYLWPHFQGYETSPRTERAKEFMAVGAPTMWFNGNIPIVWDENAPPGYLVYLTSKDGTDDYIIWFEHSDWNLSMEKVCEQTPDQIVTVGRMLWAGQSVWPGAVYQGGFTGITG